MVSLYDFIEVSAQIGSISHKNRFINWIYNKIKEKKYTQIVDKLFAYIPFDKGPTDKDMADFVLIASINYGCDVDGDVIKIIDATITTHNLLRMATIKIPSINDDEYDWYIVEINGDEPVSYSGIISNRCANSNPKLNIDIVRITMGCLIVKTMSDICRKLIFGGEDNVHRHK